MDGEEREYGMYFKHPCLAALCAVSSGCATAITESIEDQVVTGDYEVDGVRWRGGGVLFVFFKVAEEDDFLSLYGAYSSDTRDGVGGATFNELALQSMRIEIDGKIIARDMTRFNQIPFVEDEDARFVGATKCFLTDIAWKEDYGRAIRPELKSNRSTHILVD